jgi:hypothetical protein
MSKGNIVIVVADKDKNAIATVLKGTNPVINDVGPLCEFQLVDIEVDLTKNTELSGLMTAFDNLDDDNFSCAITVERLETLDLYGSPKMFGQGHLLTHEGYAVTMH